MEEESIALDEDVMLTWTIGIACPTRKWRHRGDRR